MAHPQIAVFARLADGQADRVRAIEGQKTLLSRTMHGMAYDEIHDEIYVTVQFGQAILVFRGSADGEEPPIRVINGTKTRLIAPDTLALDPVHDEIFVPEGDRILVYPRTATGNVAPIRVITGPKTGIGDVSQVVVDPLRNLIIASTIGEWQPTGRGDDDSKPAAAERYAKAGRLSIFQRTANGNTKPLRVLPIDGGRLALDASGGLLFRIMEKSFVGAWRVDDLLNGNAQIRFRIGGPGYFGRGHALTLDPQHQAVIVTDKDLNAIFTFHAPEAYAAKSTAMAQRR